MSPGRRVAIGALANRAAVAAWLCDWAGDAFLICSGYEGIFSLKDAACAGGIADRAAERGVMLGDAAQACQLIWQRYADDLPGLLRQTAWGRHIIAIGLGPDLDLCARLDTTDIVPVLREGRITTENAKGIPS